MAAMALAGCTPMRPVHLATPATSNQSTVLVYRDFFVNAGAIEAIFGAGQQDWVALSSNTYAPIVLEPAAYEFFVRSNQADQPFVFKSSAALGETKCLRVFPNPNNFAKALMPVSSYAGNTFKVEESVCPSPDALKKFEKKVPTYAK